MNKKKQMIMMTVKVGNGEQLRRRICSYIFLKVKVLQGDFLNCNW